MFTWIFLAVTGLKILLMPAYYSTDFEVHRNWLAITHNLPLSKWYYDETSQWTLDYPPFFAYLEWILSQIAKYIDPAMLKIDNLNYNSEKTVYFQRSTVIVSDIVFAIGVRMMLKALNYNYGTRFLMGSALLLANVGLIMVDHIHFQYNGLLMGILLISMSFALKRKFLWSALFFGILINMKHIFLYMAPIFGVFYLKFYCWESKRPFMSFINLLLVGGSTFVASFAPFYEHLPQVISRLFPFKRGLTHAYWAPNVWTLYNCVDKGLTVSKGLSEGSGKWTSGLVQNYEHEVLPVITPFITFALTAGFMIPCLIRLLFFTSPQNCYRDFIRSIVICSLTSFMFGWHVHEKAILMVVIPLCFLSLLDYNDARGAFLLTFIAHFSLHPLLFNTNLILIKYSLLLAFQFGFYEAIRIMYSHFSINFIEKLYLLGFIPLVSYQEIFQYYILNLSEKLPFLPLLMTSVYCSIGLLYFYIKFYLIFLRGKTFTKQDFVKLTEERKTAANNVNNMKNKQKDNKNKNVNKKKTKVQ